MIKRLAIFAAILMVAAGSLQAHLFYDMYKMKERRPYFGMRLTGGYSYPFRVKYARTPLSTRAEGYDAGISLLFHAPIRRAFYWEPQIEVYYSSLKTAGNLSQIVANEGITSATFQTIGFKVPIAIGLDLKFGPKLRKNFDIYLYTGPEFDFRMKTWFTPDHPTDIFDSSVSRPLYGDYGVDLGLRSGLGFKIKRVYIGGFFTWKLCVISKSDYGAKRQRIGGVSLGYNFRTL